MPHKTFNINYPFNGLSKEDYISLTKPAAVNYHVLDDGSAAVLDIDGYIGRDIIREWITGERSENTAKNIKNVLREISTPKIIVNINSPGGDLNDGLVIMNMLQAKRAEIVTNVMGFSASAATVIAQAGSVRRMPQTAFQLLHRVMFGVCGYINQNTTKELTNDLEVIDRQLIKMYAAASSMSENQISGLMDGGGGYGKWIDADEALKFGLIDEIYDPADQDDENTDHLMPEEAENRMQNVMKLNMGAHALINSEEDEPPFPQPKKSQRNSTTSASARARTIETLKLKLG